jgi:hypothetical protein
MMCIITASVILLNFAFQDILAVAFQRRLSERVADFACASVLAQFDRRLEANYGLYFVDITKEDELSNRFYEITRESRNQGMAGLFARGDYDMFFIPEREVTGFEISYGDSLAYKDVLREEIRDLMKYKSWGNAAVSIVEKVQAMVGAGRKVSAYTYINRADNIIEEIEGKRKDLELALNGVYGALAGGVNGFFDTIFAKNLDAEIKKVTQAVPAELEIYDERAAELLKNAVKTFLMGAVIFSENNRQALDITEDIIELTREAGKLLSKAESEARTSDDGEESADEIIKKIKERRKKLGENGDYSIVADKLGKNYYSLQKATAAEYELEQTIAAGNQVVLGEIYAVIDAAGNAYRNYLKVEQNNYEQTAASSSQESLYQTAVDAASDFLHFLPAANSEIDPDIYEELPSKEGEDWSFEKIWRSITGVAEKLKFSTSLEGYAGFAKRLEDALTGCMEWYYIDDYIATYMKNTSEVKDSNAHLLNGEREYVLFGGRTDDENMLAAYAELFSLRLGLNVLHIMSSEEKSEAVEEISCGEAPVTAAIVLSWAFLETGMDIADLHGGKKVPLIKREKDWKVSIEGVLGEAGSAIGENGGNSGSGDSTGSGSGESTNISAMSYSEYLRILLLTVPLETKLGRIQDIIELNYWKDNGMYKEIEDFAASVSAECTMKVKTFLMTDRLFRRRYDWKVSADASY